MPRELYVTPSGAAGSGSVTSPLAADKWDWVIDKLALADGVWPERIWLTPGNYFLNKTAYFSPSRSYPSLQTVIAPLNGAGTVMLSNLSAQNEGVALTFENLLLVAVSPRLSDKPNFPIIFNSCVIFGLSAYLIGSGSGKPNFSGSNTYVRRSLYIAGQGTLIAERSIGLARSTPVLPQAGMVISDIAYLYNADKTVIVGQARFQYNSGYIRDTLIYAKPLANAIYVSTGTGGLLESVSAIRTLGATTVPSTATTDTFSSKNTTVFGAPSTPYANTVAFTPKNAPPWPDLSAFHESGWLDPSGHLNLMPAAGFTDANGIPSRPFIGASKPLSGITWNANQIFLSEKSEINLTFISSRETQIQILSTGVLESITVYSLVAGKAPTATPVDISKKAIVVNIPSGKSVVQISAGTGGATLNGIIDPIGTNLAYGNGDLIVSGYPLTVPPSPDSRQGLLIPIDILRAPSAQLTATASGAAVKPGAITAQPQVAPLGFVIPPAEPSITIPPGQNLTLEAQGGLVGTLFPPTQLGFVLPAAVIRPEVTAQIKIRTLRVLAEAGLGNLVPAAAAARTVVQSSAAATTVNLTVSNAVGRGLWIRLLPPAAVLGTDIPVAQTRKRA